MSMSYSTGRDPTQDGSTDGAVETAQWWFRRVSRGHPLLVRVVAVELLLVSVGVGLAASPLGRASVDTSLVDLIAGFALVSAMVLAVASVAGGLLAGVYGGYRRMQTAVDGA